MAGIIYCFNTICDHRIYKAGHTQQDLPSRFKSYLGPSKPRTIVATRHVDDSLAAEGMMLGLLRQCAALRVRSDLGVEWFEAHPDVDEDDRHKAILLIFDVVSKAVRTRIQDEGCPVWGASKPDVPTGTVCTLPAMGAYFEALDRFVRCAPPEAVADMDTALREFERGDDCPVFAEYVMWPRATRLAVAQNRYAHIPTES